MYIPGTAAAAGTDTQVQFNDNGLLGGDADFTFNKTTNQIAIAAGSAAAPTLISTGDTNTGMWFPAADTVAWSTAGSERMRITSAGNAMIGTTSTYNDRTRLEIRGPNRPINDWCNVAINTTNAAATNLGGSISFGGENGQAVTPFAFGTIAGRYEGTGYAGYLQFATVFGGSGAIVERLRITSTGNVGIGTTAPDALLSVNGIASFGAGAAATPSIAAFGDLNTGMWFPAADTIALSTGGTEKMRIRSDGNVAIGSSGDAATAFSVARNLTGAASMYVLNFNATVQSDVTGSAFGVFTSLSTANASFSTILNHFFTFQGTIGAGSTVSLQSGYASGPTLIGATTNYAFRAANTAAVTAGKTATGFYSAINIATGGGTTWQFYGEGTAPSYFNGQTQFAAGSAGTPALAAFGDTNTGIFFPAADSISLSTNGVERFAVISTGEIRIPGNTQLTNAGNNLIYTTAATSTIELRCNNAQQATASSILLNARGPNDNILFNTNAIERMRISAAGNLGLGTSTFGTSAATVLAIATGTAPTTGPADTIQIYSTDLTAGNTMLSLYTEGTIVNTNTTAATTHRIAIRVNGTVYYLLANTAA
jgi:hypothetical protein